MAEVVELSADTDRVTAVGIMIFTLVVEEGADQALGDAEVSPVCWSEGTLLPTRLYPFPLQKTNQMLDVMDNLLKVPLDEVQISHDLFNASNRYDDYPFAVAIEYHMNTTGFEVSWTI